MGGVPGGKRRSRADVIRVFLGTSKGKAVTGLRAGGAFGPALWCSGSLGIHGSAKQQQKRKPNTWGTNFRFRLRSVGLKLTQFAWLL